MSVGPEHPMAKQETGNISGISYEDLIQKILDLGLIRHDKQK
jgi:hypothetical protein